MTENEMPRSDKNFEALIREMREFGAEDIIAIGLKAGDGGYEMKAFGTKDRAFTRKALEQMLKSLETG